MTTEPIFRLATSADAAVLARYRRCMFEDMALNEGKDYALQELVLMEAIFIQHVLARMDGEELVAWVVELDGQVVSCAAVSVLPTVPAPGRLDMRWALLHNVYTLPEFRGRGFARKLVEISLDWCRQKGFGSLALSASAAGRPLYESMGFQPTNQMSLKL
jgi:GNAT superfamily N-acetyltransferase